MEKKSFIVVFFWVIISLSILIYNQLIFFFGKEILLKVRPLDPRDFLRGDYVNLDYDIEGLPEHINNAPRENIYILLCESNDKYAKYCGFLYQKPKDGDYIKAQVKYGRIYYPQIQKYFLKEGEGKILERKLNKGGTARIHINRNGDARIKEIIVD